MRTLSSTALVVLPVILIAQAGTLDSSFGGDGIVTTVFTGTAGEVRSVAVQTDGKIIAVGPQQFSLFDFGLARYNPDGSLDPTFSGDGRQITDFQAGSNDYPFKVLVLADGKIVVCGTSGAGGGSRMALARYLPDGSLDASFGIGGLAYPDLGLETQVFSMAIQSDGKFVLVGAAITSSQNNFALARYNANGTVDTGFGTNGLKVVVFGGQSSANAVAIQPDGKIIVVGQRSVNASANSNGIIMRFLPDGTIDSSYGSSGSTIHTYLASQSLAAVALQADGKIIAAGTGHNGSSFFHGFAVRVMPNGEYDAGFSAGGLAIIGPENLSEGINDMMLDASGRILFTGNATISGFNRAITLYRYLADGTPDPAFGNQGKVTTDLDPADQDLGLALALQADGRILVGGSYRSDFNSQFAVLRFLPGSLTGIDDSENQISAVRLFPNPVLGKAVLEFDLANPSLVSVDLLDAQGRSIINSPAVHHAAGLHQHTLDLSAIRAGLYIVALSSDRGTARLGLINTTAD